MRSYIRGVRLRRSDIGGFAPTVARRAIASAVFVLRALTTILFTAVLFASTGAQAQTLVGTPFFTPSTYTAAG